MSIASDILAQTPTIYWKLDEPGGPTAFDSSGNGHNGVYGGVWTFGAIGPEAGTAAIKSSPPTSLVTFANTLFTTRASRTFLIWCSGAPSNAAGALYAMANNGDALHTARGELLDLRVNTLRTSFSALAATLPGGGAGLSGTAAYPVDQWHCYAAVYDAGAGTSSAYADGTGVGNAAWPVVGASYAVPLVTDPIQVCPAADMLLAHFAVFPRALTGAQLATIAAHTTVWPYGQAAPLLGSGTLVTTSDLAPDSALLAQIYAAVHKMY